MKRVLVALLLALAACDAPENQLRQVYAKLEKTKGYTEAAVYKEAMKQVVCHPP